MRILSMSGRDAVVKVCAIFAIVVGLASSSAPIGTRAVAQPKLALDIQSSLRIAYPTAIAWSPDGRTLAYQMTNQYGSDIKLYDFERRLSTMLVAGIPPYAYSGERPDLRWAPDGSHVIYRANNDYFTIRPAAHPRCW